MTALSVNSQIAEYLGHVKGRTSDEKVLVLLEAYLSNHLRECEREIGDCEVKYRSAFAEFAEAWEADATPGKRSHLVERDYMEWEGLEAEKKRLLDLLKRLPRNGDAKF